jgi:phenylalanyl-tRNA synthetase beta chain
MTEDNLCIERKKLAITLFSKTKLVPTLYFELRNMLETMVDDLKHRTLKFETKAPQYNYQHPRNLNKIICDGVEIGEIGIVHPVVSKKIDKKASIVFAEIDVEKLSEIENASISYEEPSKFPAIEIDLSFVSEKFAPIAKAIEDAKCSLIKNVEVTDVYEDENTKSITTRITFSHPEKTLKREEVQAVADEIIEKLKSKGILLKG